MAEIFNKEALEALDDHSEVSEMARVASPKLRIVIAAMVAMMVVVIYWCIFGTINYKVTAQGVVFPFGEATPISVPYDGAVSRLMLSHGNTVKNGMPVMEIRNVLSNTMVAAPRDGVVIQTLPLGAQFKAGEPVAWLLPQMQVGSRDALLCNLRQSAQTGDRSASSGHSCQYGARELGVCLRKGSWHRTVPDLAKGDY